MEIAAVADLAVGVLLHSIGREDCDEAARHLRLHAHGSLQLAGHRTLETAPYSPKSNDENDR
jgi:hypothetical protein